MTDIIGSVPTGTLFFFATGLIDLLVWFKYMSMFLASFNQFSYLTFTFWCEKQPMTLAWDSHLGLRVITYIF